MAGNLTLRKFELTVEQIRSLASDEQVLLVQLAHFYNMIQMLQQLLVFTFRLTNTRNPDEDAKMKARVAQNTMITRLLISTLWEGWQLFRASYFGASNKYHHRMTPEGIACLDALKGRFRKQSVLKDVRNQFGFHFDRNEIAKELARLDDGGDYHGFIGERRGNSLYYFAEEIAGMALFNAIRQNEGVDSQLDAQNVLYDVLVSSTRDFQRVIEEIMGLMLGSDIKPPLALELTDVPEFHEVSIPFFVMPPAPGVTMAGDTT